MFLRLHHEIPGMRIGVENGFGKFGKERIEDKASKNKPGSKFTKSKLALPNTCLA